MTDESRIERLRASDAERDEVMSILSDAFSQGRLTSDEFDLRLSAAVDASGRQDLAKLVADLPALNGGDAQWSPLRGGVRKGAGSKGSGGAKVKSSELFRLVRSRLAASVAVIGAWGVVFVATGEGGYYAFVWPVGFIGVATLAQAIGMSEESAQRRKVRRENRRNRKSLSEG
ncbi:DUF1707 SHOCT-like domain-containing protein [Streptomyces liangshanensis]|uniref:DUF1707 SHOCT-like domain-containing protein n=1 Tax=Streptomyces liangshanensis TaxID=2717324 RepID=UPI0036DF3CC4